MLYAWVGEGEGESEGMDCLRLNRYANVMAGL